MTNTSRRNFLKISSLTTGGVLSGIPFLNSCNQDLTYDNIPADNSLFDYFQNPSAEARPFFRWWWNGNKVTVKEAIRELKLMKEAGIGGVEINPVEMPEQITGSEREGLIWLSNEWIEVLKETLKEAKQEGMIADLIVGTGWPFGGEFLDPEETIQGIEVKTKELEGPGVELLELPRINSEKERYEQIILIPANISDISQVRDYTAEIEAESFIEIDLSPGKNILMVATWRNQFRNVMHGAPGGAGPVLDHFNKKAVEKYLHNMSDKLNPALDGKIGNWIRAMFCDSIELAGANWTGDLIEEFEKRRGYSIVPYISMLISVNLKVGDDFQEILNRVNYDYSLTLSELFTERFIIPYHNWCNENGTLSRYQAYGFPWLYTDLVDGNLIADIPEGDQWLFNRGWSNANVDNIRYAIWNKYASSGGHLKGRDIISTEAMTNTSGVFEGTLEYQKQATDLNIITGINHQVLHGFNYSPPETDFPGWIRYGGYYNENNTWWPYMRLLSDYMARLASVFQHSKPDLHVALLAPVADVWSEAGLERNAYNNTPWYLHSLWQALNHNGVCSDYISKKIINEGIIDQGRIMFGPMTFDTLILCEVGTLDPDTAESLLQFTQSGGKLIFLGAKPDHSAGLSNWKENDIKVQTAIKKALAAGGRFVNSPEEKEEKSQQVFADWAKVFIKKQEIEPEITISRPDHKLFITKHHATGQDIFFLANMDRGRSLTFNAQCKTKYRYAWRWDAETGERTPYPQLKQGTTKIILHPLESILLVYSNEKPNQKVDPILEQPASLFEIKGTWDISLDWGPIERTDRIQLDKLRSLSAIDEFKSFAGTATYTIEFDINSNSHTNLDLGRVFDIVQVILNDKDLGVKWWGNRTYDISGLLKNSGNILEIKVTNILFNYVKSLENNPVAQFWIKRSRSQVDRYPTGLLGPVRLM